MPFVGNQEFQRECMSQVLGVLLGIPGADLIFRDVSWTTHSYFPQVKIAAFPKIFLSSNQSGLNNVQFGRN